MVEFSTAVKLEIVFLRNSGLNPIEVNARGTTRIRISESDGDQEALS
jgi:hypothetical protein